MSAAAAASAAAPHKAITVSTSDPASSVDAVASLTASLAASSLHPTPTPDNHNHTTTAPPPSHAQKPPLPSASPSSPTPHYALPTSASLNREAVAASPRRVRPSTWLHEPTVPKSPSFSLPTRSSVARRRSSLSRSGGSSDAGSAGASKRNISRRKSFGVDRGATVPRSPNLRSRGLTRRRSSTSSGIDGRAPLTTAFTPNPLPAYLIQENVLPDIRLNAKTVAAMEHRVKPPTPPAPRPQSPPPGPTVPQPFDLRSVDMHAAHVATAQKMMQKEREDLEKQRVFVPHALDGRILSGPTFVPEKANAKQLTKPTDLLPDAKERSARTRAYLAAQQERVVAEEWAKWEKEREKEEKQLQEIARMYEASKFKPRPVPKSTYQCKNEDALVQTKAHVARMKRAQQSQGEKKKKHVRAMIKRHSASPVMVKNEYDTGKEAFHAEVRGRRRTVSDDFNPNNRSNQSANAHGPPISLTTLSATSQVQVVPMAKTVTDTSRPVGEGKAGDEKENKGGGTEIGSGIGLAMLSTQSSSSSVTGKMNKHDSHNSGEMSITSETSHSQDSSSGSGSSLLQKMKQSLSPLLGGVSTTG